MRVWNPSNLLFIPLLASAGCAAARPVAQSPFAADGCPIPPGTRHYQVVARADTAAIGTPELNAFLRATIALFVPPGRRPPGEPRLAESVPTTPRDSIFARRGWVPTEQDKASVEVVLRRDGTLSAPRVLARSGDSLLASRATFALVRIGEQRADVAPRVDSARIVILFGAEARPDERARVAFAIAERPLSASLERPRVPYPEQLREAGIEGDVLVEFVVDAAGVPDMGTFRVLPGNAHPAFIPAVRAAVAQQRFEPAQRDCRPVRQLAREPFRFRLPPPPEKPRPAID